MLIRILLLVSMLSLTAASGIEYIVGIEKGSPIKSSIQSLPSTSLSRTVLMTGQNGKKYECTIPAFDAPSIVSINQPTKALAKHPVKKPANNQQTPISRNPFDMPPRSASNTNTPAIKQSVPRSSNPSESLGAVSGRIKRAFQISSRPKCLMHHVHYWHYEICPHRSITQFHIAPNTKPDGPNGEFLSYQQSSKSSLGVFDPSTNADEWIYHSHDGTDQAGEWMYAQHFTKGVDQRRSVVRYICPHTKYGQELSQSINQSDNPAIKESMMKTGFIARMSEPRTFQYEFDIVTSHACDKKTIDQSINQSVNQSATSDKLAITDSLIDWSFTNSSDSDLALALSLIAPLREHCLTLTDTNWWWYKFCAFDGIIQFHRDHTQIPLPASQSVGQTSNPPALHVQELDIGHFDPSTKRTHAHVLTSHPESYISPHLTTQQLINQSVLVRGISFADTWLSQRFTNGEECDVVKGINRSTEVRYVCDQQRNERHKRSHAQMNQFIDASIDSSMHGAVLAKVEEPSTCEYVAIVAVPALCQHPLFAPKPTTVHDIGCREIE